MLQVPRFQAKGEQARKGEAESQASMKSSVVSLVDLWVRSLCPGVGFAQTPDNAGLTVKVSFKFVVVFCAL